MCAFAAFLLIKCHQLSSDLFIFVELQNILVEQLELCVEYLWKSERYELIAEVNKPIIAVFEKQRDFKVSWFIYLYFVILLREQ